MSRIALQWKSVKPIQYNQYTIIVSPTMQFSTLFLAFLASAQGVLCDSQEFGLLTIKSGSNLQYASVYASHDTLYFGSSKSRTLDGWVTDCGLLKLSNNEYVWIDRDGTWKRGDHRHATPGFYVKNGYLWYKNSEAVYAVPTDHTYKVSGKSGHHSQQVAIRAQSLKNKNPIPDYTPRYRHC